MYVLLYIIIGGLLTTQLEMLLFFWILYRRSDTALRMCRMLAEGQAKITKYLRLRVRDSDQIHDDHEQRLREMDSGRSVQSLP